MFNIFNSTVFIEIGEAIGNVGKKAFGKKKSHGELVDKAFRRLLNAPSVSSPQFGSDQLVDPREDVIDASYRVISEDMEEENGHRGSV